MYIFSLKMATVQVVETSVTNNGLSKDYPHPEDNAKIKTTTTTNKQTDTPPFKSFAKY